MNLDFRSLRTRLILAIGLPLLGIHVALVIEEHVIGKTEAIAAVERQARDLVSHRAAQIDGEFAVLAQAARSAGRQMQDIDAANDAALDRELRNLLAQDERIYGSAIAFDPAVRRAAPYRYRPAGTTQLRAMDIARTAHDYTGQAWYRLPQQTRSPTWVEPYFDKDAGDALMVTYGVPLHREGRFRGVLTLDVALDQLRAEMARVAMPHGFVALVSHQGVFLAHPQADRVMHDSIAGIAARLGIAELATAAQQMAAGKSGVVRLRDPTDGVGMNWLIFAPVASTGWTLLALADEDSILAEANRKLMKQLLISLAGAALVLLVVIFVTTRITRPLERLAATANDVAGGNHAARVRGIAGRDEIGQLATAFNRMLDELDAATAARLREVAARQAVESELKVAHDIQRGLLPHVFPPFPDHPEVDLHAICLPALSMSGDFYDYWLADDGTLTVLIADVCGKGVPAAMFMAVARTTLRNLDAPARPPSDVLEVANRTLVPENEQSMFATLFLAHYDLASGQLHYACAGHPAPLVMRHDGRIDRLAVAGGLFGVLADTCYTTTTTHLAPGETLLLFTDGATEAHDDAGVFYGEARLAALLRDTATAPAASIVAAIVADVDGHRPDTRQDDLTLLVLRRNT